MASAQPWVPYYHTLLRLRSKLWAKASRGRVKSSMTFSQTLALLPSELRRRLPGTRVQVSTLDCFVGSNYTRMIRSSLPSSCAGFRLVFKISKGIDRDSVENMRNGSINPCLRRARQPELDRSCHYSQRRRLQAQGWAWPWSNYRPSHVARSAFRSSGFCFRVGGGRILPGGQFDNSYQA
jgi:hypothetical protein